MGTVRECSVMGRYVLGDGMKRLKAEEYQRMLEEAGDDAERESEENIQAEEIDERLNALRAGGFDLGEAEQAAAAAEKPKERMDGKIIGIDTRSRPLTQAQIRFAQGVIEGKTRRQAYRDAYPNAKGSDGTISACAHKLSKDPRIERMINAGWEETQEALAEDYAAQRRYVSRALVALSKGGKQENTRLRALELLGRAAGLFKDTVPVEKPLSAEDLRRELAGHLRLVAGGKKAAQAAGALRTVSGTGGDGV